MIRILAALICLLFMLPAHAFWHGSVGAQCPDTGVPSATLMRWSPPALVNPITINVPTGFYSGTLDPNTDYILQMPNSCRTSDMQTDGGRNIRIISGCNDGGASGSRIITSDITGDFYMEGVYLKMGKNEDAINVGGAPGHLPIVYLQNVSIEGLFGTDATNHTDAFQANAGVGAICFHKLTADSNYQGLFLPGQFTQQSIQLSYINLKPNAITPSGAVEYLLWNGTTDVTTSATPAQRLASITPSTYYQVWVQPRSGQDIGCCSVQPATGVTLNGINVGAITDGSGNVTWPAFMRISGQVNTGIPPGGDFVVPGGTGPGVGYVSPGYQ